MNFNNKHYPTLFTPSFFADSNKNKEQHAAACIQKTWKTMHLRHTPTKASNYLHHVISQAWAKEQTYEPLQSELLNPEKINATQTLLMYLEQIKDFLLPQRALVPYQDKARAFLFAYLAATQHARFLDASFQEDRRLHFHAKKMLDTFEQLLSSISIHQLETIADYEQHGINELSQFHKAQSAYYTTYTRWKNSNPHKLFQFCLEYYNQFELKRLAILHNLLSKPSELYMHIVNEQKHIQNKIENHFGSKGLDALAESVLQTNSYFEKQKWLIAPTELLSHEVALNPQFTLKAETFEIQPKIKPRHAIKALLATPPHIGPLLILFDELLEKIILLTPNNKTIRHFLSELLNKKQLIHCIEAKKIKPIFHVIEDLLWHIYKLESIAYNIETEAFINEYRLLGPKWPTMIQAIEFIYARIGQINFEKSNFYIQQSHFAINNTIVSTEQKQFKTHHETHVPSILLEYIKHIVIHPEKQHLSLALLCSAKNGTYLTHSLILHILQSPQASIVHVIPETFYLDRIRLMDFHSQYQNIIYVAGVLSYLKLFYRKYQVFLSRDEWVEQKNRLLTEQSNPYRSTKKPDVSLILLMQRLRQNHKILEDIDKLAFIRLIEQLQEGTSPILPLLNERLGDALSAYFIKEQWPKMHADLWKETGLDTQLLHLGKALMPMVRLHIKVHNSFYRQEIDKQLWAPLWLALKQESLPKTLPVLFLIEESTLSAIHHTLHKLAFVITGLLLINQTLIHHDMWQHKSIDHHTLKKEAISYHLPAKIYQRNATKKDIQSDLQRLMNALAKKHEIQLEALSEKHLSDMFCSAKKERSRLYKACLDELIKQLKNNFGETKNLHVPQNTLITQFQEEVDWLQMQLKQCMEAIKKHHSGDDYELDPEFFSYHSTRNR